MWLSYLGQQRAVVLEVRILIEYMKFKLSIKVPINDKTTYNFDCQLMYLKLCFKVCIWMECIRIKTMHDFKGIYISFRQVLHGVSLSPNHLNHLVNLFSEVQDFGIKIYVIW